MNHHYRDITARLGAPQWWDEVGVPRYCRFGPDETNNIYASQAILMEVACQGCDRRFPVALTYGPLGELAADPDVLHYGDPPGAECCPAGPTMNSVPIRVLEFWERPWIDWIRRPELERAIACDWDDRGTAAS